MCKSRVFSVRVTQESIFSHLPVPFSYLFLFPGKDVLFRAARVYTVTGVQISSVGDKINLEPQGLRFFYQVALLRAGCADKHSR